MREIENPDFLVFVKTGKHSVAQIVFTKTQQNIVDKLICATCDGQLKLGPEKIAVFQEGDNDHGMAEHYEE